MMNAEGRQPERQHKVRALGCELHTMKSERRTQTMKPRKCRYRGDISPEQCWVHISDWITRNRPFSRHKSSHILRFDKLADVKPVDFVTFTSSILPSISGDGPNVEESYVAFCIIRILQGYCATKKSALKIEPFMLDFTRNLLILLNSDGFHPADVRIIFSNATQVIDCMLKLVNWKGILRTVILVAYFKLLILSLSSARSRLELRRAVLLYMLKRLAVVSPTDLQALRASLRPLVYSIFRLIKHTGDYDVQIKLLTVLMSFIPKEEHSMVGEFWFRHAWTFMPMRAYCPVRYCCSIYRYMLNHFNRELGSACKVHSYEAKSVQLGSYYPTMVCGHRNDLWVDFNEESRSVMFYCLIQFTTGPMSSKTQWSTVVIYFDDVQKVQLESKEVAYVLTLTLNFPCRCLFDRDVAADLDNSVVTLEFLRLSNEQTRGLRLDEALWKIYGPDYEFQKFAPLPAVVEQHPSTSASGSQITTGKFPHPNGCSSKEGNEHCVKPDAPTAGKVSCSSSESSDDENGGRRVMNKVRVRAGGQTDEGTSEKTRCAHNRPLYQTSESPDSKKRKLAVLYGLADNQDDPIKPEFVSPKRKSRRLIRGVIHMIPRSSRSESRGRSREKKHADLKKVRHVSAPVADP